MSLPSLQGNTNAEKIWNFFTTDGELSPEQAAGVMGNIRQESNYDPTIEEGAASSARHNVRPVGFGIVQWTGDRRVALESAASDQGLSPSDLGFQLAYLLSELKSRQVHIPSSSADRFRDLDRSQNEWEAIKSLSSMEDALVLFHDSFERSIDTAEEVISVRGSYAKQALDSFRGGTGSAPAGSSSSSASSDCTPFAGGDLIQTLLAYAHPEYHPNNSSGPVPPPTSAYLGAATRLAAEGKWVGGGQAEIGIPGIDCGGFVSILLTESGFEPDYNFGLDLDRGSSNQEYGQLPWAKRHWTFLGNGGIINPSDLRPGDVAYSNGHTFVYVGQVDGFESQYASASYDWWRAPMAGGGFETATSPDYVWYGRREGVPPAYGTTSMSDPIPDGNDVNPGSSTWNGGE